jgi:hypothetical protein
MKYMDFSLKYAVQTDRTFNIRYKSKIHMHKFRNNNGNSGYSNHVLSTGYTYRSITDIVNIIKSEKVKRKTSKYIRKIPHT